MKKIIVVLIFSVVGNVVLAQNWVKKADLTDSTLTFNGSTYGIGGATTFTLGDTGYVVGGANGFSFFHYTWIYDAVTNTWDTVASFPYNENGTGGGVKAGFAINDKGYVGTGSFFGLPLTKEFFEYDPATNTWIQKAFMSVQRGYGVGFAISGRGFIGSGVGGVNVGTFGPALHDFWEYNPNEGDSGTWTQVTPYPGEGNQLCFAFTIGDKAYVGGGAITNSGGSTTGYADDFWEYDTTSKVWTRVATFPGGPRFQGSSLSGCDWGYIGLGQNSSGNLVNDFWKFDPDKGDSGTWTQIATIPISSGRGSPEAFTIGKSIFTGMGGTSNGNADDWWEYTPSFTPAFFADTSVCQGGTIAFKDTSDFYPTNWYWQFPGGTPDTSTSDSVTITYNDIGYHDVILTAWNGCGDSATKTFTNYVNVGAGGVLTIQPPSPSVCNGQSITLSVTSDLGGTFTWAPGTGLIDSTQSADSVTASPYVTTTYSIFGTGTTGCGYEGTVTVTVDSAPPFIILPLDTSFCSGQMATLYVSNGNGGSGFLWSPLTGLSDSTGISVVASPTLTTTYTVIGLDSNNCPSSGVDVIGVIPSPNKPTFHQHGDTLISSSKYDNQWYQNGNLLTNDTSQNLIITTTGEYWVNVNNEVNGCSTSSDSTLIDTIEGINQLSTIIRQLSIYPNPFSNDVFIKINSSVGDLEDWKLQVTDVLGRTVYSQSLLNHTNAISLTNLASGVYFVTIINKTGRAVFPLVRQN